MSTIIVTSESANNSNATRKINAAKAAVNALKIEANSLAQILKIMYDMRHRPEIAPLANYLRLTDETNKRVAVSAAIRLIGKFHPYISKDESGKTTYFKRAKVDGKIYRLTATQNPWDILEAVFNAVDKGMSQRNVAEGEYITIDGMPVNETTARQAEARKSAKRFAREAKKNDAKIAADLLAALNAVYAAAKNTPAEIHILHAIAAISE